MFVPVVDNNQRPLMPNIRLSWTDLEDKLLEECYGKIPWSEMQNLFPNRTRDSVKGRARNLGLKGNKLAVMSLAKKIHTIDYSFFAQPNAINSYWAGFIAADGGISQERQTVYIQVSQKDLNHIRKFALSTNYSGQIKQVSGGSYKPESVQYKLNICGVGKWIEDLDKGFNIHQRKTYTLNPPLRLDNSLILCFIAGYIDGDGSIYQTSNTYKLKEYKTVNISIRGTESILLWIKDAFDSMFISQRPCSLSFHDKHYQYRVSGKRAIEIINCVNSLNLPILQRKWGISFRRLLGTS